jgi:pilus assembly protein TadC
LSEAIKRAGKEIMSGSSLEEGLKEIPLTIKSDDLKRTIDLIIQGIRGGGQLVSLLEENATDIRRRQAMTKEIKANTMMYAIFIAFAGCLGAPGLYALSSYLTKTMGELGPDIAMSGEVSSKVSFMQMQGTQISAEFLLQFSIAAILLTTFFGGIILGLIGTGREKEGLKYAPVLTIIALLVFFGATFLINIMFATMLPS